MLLARSGSPLKGFTPVVHLDNLEMLQDRWAKQYDGIMRPPSSPRVNSPRSLHACTMCGLTPERDLEKLSLKQHLLAVIGDPTVDAPVAALSVGGEARAATQVAVLAFQRAAIGLGTAKEKVTALHSFQRQEQLRVPRLASAQEARRHLLAEEAHARRRRMHAEVSSSERSLKSVSPGTNGSNGGAKASAGSVSSLIPSPGRDQMLTPTNARSRRHSRHSSTEARGPQRSPPISPPLSGRSRRAGSVSPFSQGHSLNDFHPPVISDGYRPYVPRDAAALNSEFFGNRAHDDTAGSHPSRVSDEKLHSVEVLRPGSRTRKSRPSHNDSFDEYTHAGGNAHPSTPADRTARDDALASIVKITPGGRNDISIASISSSQFGWILGSADASDILADGKWGARAIGKLLDDSAVPQASMFHQVAKPSPAVAIPTGVPTGASVTTSAPPRMGGVPPAKAASKCSKPSVAAPMTAVPVLSHPDATAPRKVEQPAPQPTPARRDQMNTVRPSPPAVQEAVEFYYYVCANPAPLCHPPEVAVGGQPPKR